MKVWEIYNYIYGDVCSDTWFGKESKHYTIGFVIDTEENVKSLVEELNANRNSYYSKREPADEWDTDFEDANYIAYTEVKFSTYNEIRNNYLCR